MELLLFMIAMTLLRVNDYYNLNMMAAGGLGACEELEEFGPKNQYPTIDGQNVTQNDTPLSPLWPITAENYPWQTSSSVAGVSFTATHANTIWAACCSLKQA